MLIAGLNNRWRLSKARLLDRIGNSPRAISRSIHETRGGQRACASGVLEVLLESDGVPLSTLIMIETTVSDSNDQITAWYVDLLFLRVVLFSVRLIAAASISGATVSTVHGSETEP